MIIEVENNKIRLCGKEIYVAKSLQDSSGKYLEFKPLRYGTVSIYALPNAKLAKLDIYRAIVPAELNLYYIKISVRHWSLKVEGAEEVKLSCEIGSVISGKEIILRGRYYAKENYYFKFLLTQDLKVIEMPPDDVERL